MVPCHKIDAVLGLPTDPPILRLNAAFSSYKELERAVRLYERANGVQFWTRDAKRLHRASPSVYQIVRDHPQLEYCSLKFACMQGGRPSQATCKRDCKAAIFAKLNEERNRLIITQLEEEHNHHVPSAEAFKRFPKNQRRKEARKRLLEKRKLGDDMGVDLESLEGNSAPRSNNLKKIGKMLEDKYFCGVDLQSDENDNVYGFFFQDSYMKKCFELFPEVLTVDGTYRLRNIRCWVYILGVENSLGTSNVVGVGLVTVEDKASVDWMIKRFKEKNPKWGETKIIISDRQSSEYCLARTHFPGASSIISHFQATNTYKEDINQIKSELREKEDCLLFFKKLSMANSDEDYETILSDMKDTVSPPFLEYFHVKWHHLKRDWVKGLNTKIRNLVQNPPEDLQSELRHTVSSCKAFGDFVRKLFLALYLKRNRFKRVASDAMQFSLSQDMTEAEKFYRKHLTLYAFKKIEPFLTQATGSTLHNNIASEFNCDCDLFTVMRLPCEHILLYRRSRGLSLFDEGLFSKRWTREYVKNLLVIGEKCFEDRFKEAEGVCSSLATLCCDVSSDEFEERLDLLKRLKRCWESGEQVEIRIAENVDVPEVEDIIIEFIP